MIKRLLDCNDGKDMDLVLLLKDSSLHTNRNDERYLVLQLNDSSGTIRENLWNTGQQNVDTSSPGTTVELSGRREEYQDWPQIRIYSLRAVGPNEGYDLNQFVHSAPIKQKDLKEEINKRTFGILNPTWSRIVRYLLKKWNRQFFSYPADKSNHHAVGNGLASHTASMLRGAEEITSTCPQINRSLLYAGRILHGIGKVIESSGPAATKYATERNLIGHLALINEQIMLAVHELKIDERSEDLMLLRHLTLFHHGLSEYGTAHRLVVLEAEVLHKIDDLDTTVYTITNALQQAKPDEFTETIRSQDSRRFYHPKNDEALNQTPKLE